MSRTLSGLAATASTLLAAATAAGAPGPTLYDQAVAILRERYFDREFRETRLPALAERYRAEAAAAPDRDARRDCLARLLSHVPASHLGVLSEESFAYLIAELAGEKRPTFGLLALRHGDDHFTAFVLEGGPAAQAGILPWERIVAIDDQPPARTARRD